MPTTDWITYPLNWANYPNFTPIELSCKHCGSEGISPEMMEILQGIRTELAATLFLSSGYRCVKHPVEQEKDKPGEHTYGMAVDILCHGDKALKIIELAQGLSVRRIGVHQKGNVNGRFVHLGIGDRHSLTFPVGLWTY